MQFKATCIRPFLHMQVKVRWDLTCSSHSLDPRLSLHQQEVNSYGWEIETTPCGCQDPAGISMTARDERVAAGKKGMGDEGMC